MPAARRLIMPARSIKRWLASSASEGASLSVDRKNWDTRMASFVLQSFDFNPICVVPRERDLAQRQRFAVLALDGLGTLEQRPRLIVAPQRLQRVCPSPIRWRISRVHADRDGESRGRFF